MSALSIAFTLIAAPVGAHAEIVSYATGAHNTKDQPDVLKVFFKGDTDIKSVKAVLMPDRNTDKPVIEVTDFTVSRNGIDSVASATVRPGFMDIFQVSIEAYDTKDNKLDVATGWGSTGYRFDWVIWPAIELAADPAAPDRDHRTVTLSGRVTGLWPTTGETTPLPARQLTILLMQGESSSPRVTATTGEDGRFSTTIQPDRRNLRVMATTNWDAVNEPDLALAFSDTVNVNVRPTRTRMSATVDKTRVPAAATVTVTGTLERQTGDVWESMAGQKVLVDAYDSDGDRVPDKANGEATTDATGRFSATVQARYTHEIEVLYKAPDIFYENSSAKTSRLTVPRETKISSFSTSLNQYAELSVKGKIDVVGDTWGVRSGTPILIEYSGNGRTGWRLIKTLKTSGFGDFSGTFWAPAAAGYYRARYVETNDYYASVSPVKYARRYETRVAGLNASPEPVRKGRPVTVTGTLQHRNSSTSSWTGFRGQKVSVIFRFYGKKTWYLMASTTTDSRGRFTRRINAPGSGTWTIAYYGDKYHFSTSPNGDYVSAR
ncbi:hypothetical protein GCM10009780_28060 [Actinomadura alba]